MSPLKQTLDNLKISGSRSFGGVYSPINSEHYYEKIDQLRTGVTGMDGDTQQIFNLTITPERHLNGYWPNSYEVEIKYFELMDVTAIIPSQKLLDFLLNARIVVHPKLLQVSFIYAPLEE